MLESYYLKPVIIIAPDLQFPMLNFCDHATCPTCNKCQLKLQGWGDYYRYVHGKDVGIIYFLNHTQRLHKITDKNEIIIIIGHFILQRQYKCGNSSCRRKCAAIDTIDQEWVPSFVRIAYPLIKSGETFFMTDLADTVFDDMLTGKTLEEIGTTVRNHRYKKYLEKRLSYYSAKKLLDTTPGSVFSTATEAEEFSTFEDHTGFNEISQPDVETVKRFFVNYVKERREILDSCLDNIVPFSAVSFDCTFHIQKRTKVFIFIHYSFLKLYLTLGLSSFN
jgi:hypothetical protein